MLPAEARTRARNGAWVQLRAARFAGEDRVAVIVEPAHPARIFDLMMSAHGLIARERDVVAARARRAVDGGDRRESLWCRHTPSSST